VRWALAWSCLHLAGSVLGAGLAARFALPPVGDLDAGPQVLTRISGLLAASLFHRSRPAVPAWAALVLGIALLSGWLEAGTRLQRARVRVPGPLAPAEFSVWRGVGVLRITSWATGNSPGKWRATAMLQDWFSNEDKDGNLQPGVGQGVLVTGSGRIPLPGQVVRGLLALTIPAGADLPGGFDYREFLAGRHLLWLGRLEGETETIQAGWAPGKLVRFLADSRNGLLERLDRILPGREAELAGAVLLGNRTTGSRDGAVPFTDLGLAHLFAVSGLHVGILMGILMLILVFPGRLLGMSASGRFWPLLVFLVLYVLVTGLSGSVVRAAGLGILAAGAGVLGRRSEPLHLLGLLFWLTTLWEPEQVLDTGVRLSYLAAGGIMAVMRLSRGVLAARGPGAALGTALTVSLAAQWFTLPQAALSFGRFSLLAPLANLVAVPLFGLAVWGITLALLLVPLWPGAGQALAALSWLVLRGLAGGVAFASRRTGGWNLGLAPTPPLLGIVWVLLTGGGLLILHKMAKERIGRRPGILLVLAVVVAGHGLFAWSGHRLIANGRMRVWQFDVGQGDCSLVVFPDRWSALIDTGGVFGRGMWPPDGPLRRRVGPFLRRGWLSHPGVVLLTHGHLDHTGGAPVLAQDFPPRKWVCGGRSGEILARNGTMAPVANGRGPATIHACGSWRLELVYPLGDLPPGFQENDRSLVTVLWRGEQPCMVWSGDLELTGEARLLEAGTLPAGTQVWKAGHHGSDTSGGREWLDRLAPRLILVSCGVGNKYGHPSHGAYVSGVDTVDVLRTDLDGSIQLEWDSRGTLEWRTRRQKGQLPPSS